MTVGWVCVCEVLRESETDLILKFVIFSSGAPQVVRYSVSKEVEAISGRDVRLEMEVCSDPVPSKTTWEWGALQVEAGKVISNCFAPEIMHRSFCIMHSLFEWDFMNT